MLSSHWFSALGEQRFALIVSNPPYIAEQDPHLAAGDVRFEPSSALVAGSDGLDDLRQIITQAPQHLLPGGWLLLEHGFDQAEAVRALLKQFIASEEPEKPLSDNQLSDLLKEQGIECARRTVAKYREALRIAPANLRKAI